MLVFSFFLLYYSLIFFPTSYVLYPVTSRVSIHRNPFIGEVDEADTVSTTDRGRYKERIIYHCLKGRLVYRWISKVEGRRKPSSTPVHWCKSDCLTLVYIVYVTVVTRNFPSSWEVTGEKWKRGGLILRSTLPSTTSTVEPGVRLTISTVSVFFPPWTPCPLEYLVH